MKRLVRRGLGLAPLLLWACSSDNGIKPEPAPGPSMALWLRQMPFLEALVADGLARPAEQRDERGFVLYGKAPSQGATVAGGRPVRKALRAELSRAAGGELRLDASGATVGVRRKGAGKGEGHLDRGAVVYEGAFEGADALVVSRGEGVEELVVTRNPDIELVYELDLHPGWRLEGHADMGLVEVRDEGDHARLRVWARDAWDDHGNKVPVELAAVGNEVRLRAKGASVIDPYFIGVGTILDARYEFTATRLADGRVLLTGGYAEQDVDGFATAEIYDPGTDSFSRTKTNMGSRRRRHVASLLLDGRVLITGGDNQLGAVETAELYDPVADRFTPTSVKPTSTRSYPSMTTLLDGRVLIAGGQGAALSFTLYDPKTDTFEPERNLLALRSGHSATRLDDGRVLIAGGASWDAELFDPVTNQSTKQVPMITPRSNHSALKLKDGRVLIAGGDADAGDGTGEVFDPKANEFTSVGKLAGTSSRHDAAVLHDGRVLFVGKTASLFDISTKTSTPASATPREDHKLTLLPDGRVLIAGGSVPNNLSGFIKAAEVFDPRLDAASALVSSPRAPATSGSATAVVSPLEDGRVLITGGSNQYSESLDNVALLSMANGGFTPVVAPMKHRRAYHTATPLLDGTVLVAGGWRQTTEGPNAVLDTVEVYNPTTLSSKLLPKLPSALCSHSATRLVDGRVLLTGGGPSLLSSGTKAFLYSPTTDKTIPTNGEMAAARSSNTSTLLEDGKVLVVGGNFGDTPLAEVFDPATGTFAAAAGANGSALNQVTATPLLDGTVLLTGGFDNSAFTSVSKAAIYDPASNTVTPTLSGMIKARAQHSATRLPDGTVLLLGGRTTGFEILATAEIYDPASKTFHQLAKGMRSPRAGHAALLRADGKVVIIADYGEVEVYDPATQESLSIEGKVAAQSALTELLDGRALVTGGGKEAVASVFITSTGVATRGPAIERHLHTANLMGDGSVLLVGGQKAGVEAPDSPFVTSIQRVTVDGALDEVGSLAVGRARHTTTRLPDGRWLVAGGEGDDGYLASYEIISRDGKVSSGPVPLSAKRSRHGATLLPDGRVLLVGGRDLSAEVPGAEVVDPVSGKVQAAGGAKIGTEVSVGYVGTDVVLFSGSLGMARYQLGTQLLLELDLAAEARLATLANGYALSCRQSCEVLGKPAIPLGDMANLPLTLDDRALSLGTTGLVFTGVNHGSRWVGWGTAQPADKAAPSLGDLPKASWSMREKGTVSGAGFALGPDEADAALWWKPLDNAGPLHRVEATFQEGTTELTVPETAYAGPGWLFVSSHGAVSQGRLMTINQSVQGAACVLDDHCASGHCTDGVCCDRACTDSCQACSAAMKGSGVDGECGAIGAGLDPRPGGCAPSPAECGPKSGKCGGNGACELPDGTTPCSAVPNGRCASGVCAPPPPADCDASNERVVYADKSEVACKPYLCAKGACLTACSGDDECSKGAECVGGKCVASCDDEGTRVVQLDGNSIPCGAYRCRQGACLQACVESADCAKGAECVGGKCVASCDEEGTRVVQLDGNSIPCGVYRCRQGACLSRCEGNDDCAEGTECVAGACVASCDEAATKVVQLDGSTIPCGAYRCRQGACLKRCQGEDDCAQDAMCIDGECRDGCSQDRASVVSVTTTGTTERPCAPYRCSTGACMTRCRTHDDCAPGNRCESDQTCKPAGLVDTAPDPGACAVVSRRTSSGGMASLLLAAALSLAARRRRRAVAAATVIGASSRALFAQAPTQPASSAPASSAPVPTPQGSSSPPAASSAPAAPAATDAQRDKARDLLKRGVALDKAGEPQKALDFFLQSRAVFPAKGNTLNAARTLEKLGRFDEALEMYEETVASFFKSFDEDDQRDVPADMARLRGQLGSAFISSNTTGAVVIDGRERGKLPLGTPIRLMPGQHAVRVIKDGYRSFEGSITIKAGETARLDAKLEQLLDAGGLKIEDPTLEGGEVEVDGVRVGTLPWEGTLAPGPHVVVARKEDRGTPPTLAMVLQGQTALLRLRASKLGPVVRVKASPETAEIKLGNVSLGKGSWEGLLPAGRHTVSASEDGYFSRSVALDVPVQDGAELGRDVDLSLTVDEAHPKWPRKPSGKIYASLLAMYGVGSGFKGDVDASCDQNSCSRGLASGPAAGLEVEYEFAFRLGLGLSGGFVTLQSHLERDVPRAGGRGAQADATYQIDDRLRFKGYWLGAGLSYRVPLGSSWSLRPAVRGGVVFARSSDTASAIAVAGGTQVRASIDGSGTETASTPLFVLPEVGITRAYDDWSLGLSVGAWMTLSKGPSLSNGTVRVAPACNGQQPNSAGCLPDWEPDKASAHGVFVMAMPRLWISRVF